MVKNILILILCLFCVACPPKTAKKASQKKSPDKKSSEISEKTSRQVTAQQGVSEVITPQRRASARVVENGIRELDAKNYDRALELFQEAANIDPSNGVAYYYLALTNIELEQKDVAMGLLDKAEALLKRDSDWLEKIDELRESMGSEKTEQIVPLPKVGKDEF